MTYIDPQVQQLLESLSAEGDVSVQNMPLADFREASTKLFKQISLPRRETGVIEDLFIPGTGDDVRCKIYRPKQTSEFMPVLVYYHGGGLCTLSPDDFEGTSTALAKEADCIVIAPDYRLAPEHPFPASLEDAYAVYEWLLSNASQIGGDTNRIALSGDSAGGYLVAAVTLEAKRLGAPQPSIQILLYPLTDCASRSWSKVTKSFFLDEGSINFMLNLYHSGNTLDPRISPLRATDHSNLAPAFIITAGEDPFLDEGAAYAAVLRRAGVRTSYHCYEGMIHGFFSMGAMINESNFAVQHVAGVLRHMFGNE